MITLEDTDTEILTQHNEKENLNIEQLQKKVCFLIFIFFVLLIYYEFIFFLSNVHS